jgi:hypothetical protein
MKVAGELSGKGQDELPFTALPWQMIAQLFIFSSINNWLSCGFFDLKPEERTRFGFFCVGICCSSRG